MRADYRDLRVGHRVTVRRPWAIGRYLDCVGRVVRMTRTTVRVRMRWSGNDVERSYSRKTGKGLGHGAGRIVS